MKDFHRWCAAWQNMEPIEILLAVYNGEKFIREQIESIIKQTHPVQLIIRDNHSEDNTAAVVQDYASKYPGQVSLIQSTTNIGVIGNFTALMEVSKARYVMFSDADDLWHPEKVAKTFAKMKELESQHGYSKPFLVHSDLTVVDRNLNIIHPSFWNYSNLKPEQSSRMEKQLVQNTITGCTTMVNRMLLDLALPIPEEIVMHDWWLGLIAAAFGKIETVNEPTMLYRQHGMNDTGAKKYGLISYFNRIRCLKTREKIASNKRKRFRQAEALLKNFANRLDAKQKEILCDYLKIEKASFLKKRALMIKHGFYKQGFLRNAAEFLPMDWLFV